MLKKVFKIIAPFLLIFISAALISGLSIWGHMESTRVPPAETMRSPLNVSGAYGYTQQRAIKKSTLSAVRVIAFSSDDSQVSVSTGTYFKHLKQHYVLTVQHGIMAPSCELIQIEVDGQLHECTAVIAYDIPTDYAILAVSEITNRTPLNFPRDFVRGARDWKTSASALTSLIYTGYPNTIGPVTLSGRVMGMSMEELIYFNSYAWAGSSGSGVFNMKGKLVGYIVAIDVGQTEYGYDVLENVILVVPNYKIDWTVLFK
jgi:hypothetical protein